MSASLDPFQLSSVTLSERKELPTCTAIYFAIDSRNRVLYVGKAKNLAARWKNHHRLHALEQMDKEYPVRLAWQAWNEESLNEAEKSLILSYQPLLNNTKVEMPSVIPSEHTVRDFLKTFSRRLIICGIIPETPNKLLDIYLGYDPKDHSAKGTANKIKYFINQSRDKNTSLKFKRHKVYRDLNAFAGQMLRPGSRLHRTMARQYKSYNNHWEFGCNGVIIHITPIRFYRDYKEHLKAIKLAGINCRAITQEALIEAQSINRLPSNFSVFIQDPIPLLWSKQTK